MNRVFAILWLLLGMCGMANAQQLSVDSCKALALRNNAAVKNADLDVQAAEEVKKQAFTKYFPNVSALAGGYYALKPLVEYGIDDIRNATARQWLHNLYFEYGAAIGLPDKLSLFENGVMVGAAVVQPVYMGGQIVNGNRLAKVGVEAAELQQQLTQEKLLLQVEENYWLVVSLMEKRKTLRQALVFLDTLHRDATVAAEAGLISPNDSLKVVLKQHEMQSNLLKVNNGIQLATMALCQMIGIEYSDNLILTDTFEDTSNRLYSMSDAITAVQNRKESQLLDLQVSAGELKKKMAIGEALPHLMVGASASYGNLVFDRYTANGLAFATLQVPLTGWWESSHKMKQQDILIQKAENERIDLTQKMVLETQQAWFNVQEANSQVLLSETAVRDAETNWQSSQVNYQAGLIPISELLEAQTLYRQAQDQLIDAKISYRTALLRYRMLVGDK